MSSQTLVIAGMHRSGTSLVTNWLHRCGLQVGESLLEEGPSNAEGHFEDMEFLKMHEEILAGNGLPSTGLIAGEEINISDYQLEKLKAIIKVKRDHFKQWGWKEPRTCLFLDVYKELLPEAEYLVIMRDYQSVTNSLLKRDFVEMDVAYGKRSFFTRLKWAFKKEYKKRKLYRKRAEDYLKVWIDYNEHILSFLEKLSPEQYLVVNYTLLETNDRKVFSFLTGKWGFDLKFVPFKKVFKENLISSVPDLSPYIEDKSLITRASALEKEFDKYMLRLDSAV